MQNGRENDPEDHDPEWEPDPEDFAPAPPKTRNFLYRRPKVEASNPAILMLSCCILVSVYSWQSPVPRQFSVSGASIFEDGEYLRLLSALFAHADMGHLLSNSYLLLIFGWLLRAYFGFFVFPICTLGLGVLTNLLVVGLYPPKVHLLGASGMVYAMVGLWLTLYLKFETERSFGSRLFRTIAFILIMLFPSTFVPTTSYLAHGLGFGCGVALGLLLWLKQRPQDQELLLVPVGHHPSENQQLH